MRFWLDTEFNDFKGELISMALVADDGREWYEVLPCANPSPWVAENVMPILGKAPVMPGDMALSLHAFLKGFDRAHIVADWPEDVSHFCNALIVGPGLRIDTPPITFEVRRDLPNTADISAIPHNALEDAKALRLAGVEMHNASVSGAEPQAERPLEATVRGRNHA